MFTLIIFAYMHIQIMNVHWVGSHTVCHQNSLQFRYHNHDKTISLLSHSTNPIPSHLGHSFPIPYHTAIMVSYYLPHPMSISSPSRPKILNKTWYILYFRHSWPIPLSSPKQNSYKNKIKNNSNHDFSLITP